MTDLYDLFLLLAGEHSRKRVEFISFRGQRGVGDIALEISFVVQNVLKIEPVDAEQLLLVGRIDVRREFLAELLESQLTLGHENEIGGQASSHLVQKVRRG